MRLSTRLATGLALAAVALAPSAANAASPYEKGPAPTVTSLRAAAGPYTINRAVYGDSATPGFGAATVYWPKTTTGETFGGVAFAPGFTETSAVVNWLAARVASFGFTTIVFNVNNTFTDAPSDRGRQLNAALYFLANSSAAKPFTDPARLGVSGHSMGGGGVLEAERARPAIKAGVALEPWNLNTNWGSVTSPTLLIGAQNDIIAPVGSHAIPFYRSLPATTPKQYLEFKGADHFVSNSPTSKVGAATVAWFKRFIDDDTRYSAFLCPSQQAQLVSDISRFSSNCPF
jgi:predicted dienelactone hydrolase